MTRPLAEHIPDLTAALRGGRQAVLFLDFDGTLVPITDRPFECDLTPSIRTILHAIQTHHRLPVAIISGRDLADLRPRIGIDSIVCAGNHGFEIAGPNVEFREPTAVSLIGELSRIIDQLRSAIVDIPGAWVQDKTLTATVHFRETPCERIAELTRIVEGVIASVRDSGRFVLRPGQDVLEVRPAVDWHKGRAARWLMKRLGGDLPIVLGDDLTDEDAFLELGEGVTVVVGERRPTAAKYHLEGTSDVAGFLHWLHEVLATSVR